MHKTGDSVLSVPYMHPVMEPQLSLDRKGTEEGNLKCVSVSLRKTPWWGQARTAVGLIPAPDRTLQIPALRQLPKRPHLCGAEWGVAAWKPDSWLPGWNTCYIWI